MYILPALHNFIRRRVHGGDDKYYGTECSVSRIVNNRERALSELPEQETIINIRTTEIMNAMWPDYYR